MIGRRNRATRKRYKKALNTSTTTTKNNGFEKCTASFGQCSIRKNPRPSRKIQIQYPNSMRLTKQLTQRRTSIVRSAVIERMNGISTNSAAATASGMNGESLDAII